VPARGAWNMAVDETILEAVGQKESSPTLRMFAWQPACLSLGYAQSIQDVDLNSLKEQGWDLVRRPTGGRAVLHVDELTYSVSGPIDEPRLSGTVLESYNRIALALVNALDSLGLPVQVQEQLPRSNGTDNPVCFQVPSTYEITVHGKKLIGSAQVRRKEGMLQHGSLPLFGDLGRITKVLFYEDVYSRSQSRNRLVQHAITVKDAVGRQVSWEEAANAFIDSFSNTLDLDLEPGVLSEKETAKARDLEVVKYLHPDWTMRKKLSGESKN
jgi:lipoate-protein ligase A